MRTITTLIIILTLSLSSCKFFREKGWFQKNKADTMVVWQARQDSLKLVAARIEQEKVRAAEQARADSLQAVEAARIAMEASFKYHIIVGSFLTPEYADKYLDYYRSLGYTNAKLVNWQGGRWKLVSAEAHDNIRDALKRLSSYQDTVEFESWLFINE